MALCATAQRQCGRRGSTRDPADSSAAAPFRRLSVVTREVGGTGSSAAGRGELLAQLVELEVPHHLLDTTPPPPTAGARWVRPELLGEATSASSPVVFDTRAGVAYGPTATPPVRDVEDAAVETTPQGNSSD